MKKGKFTNEEIELREKTMSVIRRLDTLRNKLHFFDLGKFLEKRGMEGLDELEKEFINITATINDFIL